MGNLAGLGVRRGGFGGRGRGGGGGESMAERLARMAGMAAGSVAAPKSAPAPVATPKPSPTPSKPFEKKVDPPPVVKQNIEKEVVKVPELKAIVNVEPEEALFTRRDSNPTTV